MGRTLDNAMLNIGMKDIATGPFIIKRLLIVRGIERIGRF